MSTKVLLCGVGGQGTILAAHLLAEVAMRCNVDVKVSEIHGMSQRGGAVTTVVNFGNNVQSMVTDKGCANIIVSFEMIEALRNIEQLADNGVLLVNDEIIKPSSVLTGKTQLPPNIRERLLDLGALLVPAQSSADEIGNSKVANVVLLGALSAVLDFPVEIWEKVVTDNVPPKTIDANISAFNMGRAFVKEHRSN